MIYNDTEHEFTHTYRDYYSTLRVYAIRINPYLILYYKPSNFYDFRTLKFSTFDGFGSLRLKNVEKPRPDQTSDNQAIDANNLWIFSSFIRSIIGSLSQYSRAKTRILMILVNKRYK